MFIHVLLCVCFQTVFIAVVVVVAAAAAFVVVVVAVDFVAFFVVVFVLLLAFCSAVFKSYLNRFYMRETVFKYEMITFL